MLTTVLTVTVSRTGTEPFQYHHTCDALHDRHRTMHATSEYGYRIVLMLLDSNPCLCNNWRLRQKFPPPFVCGPRQGCEVELCTPRAGARVATSPQALLHDRASTSSNTHTPTPSYPTQARHTLAVMANINWRTINIDALDPDSPANFDLSSLTPAVEPISTADVQNTAQQIRQLLRGGDNEGALQGALESAPYGADDKGKVRWCLLPHNLHNTSHVRG